MKIMDDYPFVPSSQICLAQKGPLEATQPEPLLKANQVMQSPDSSSH